MISARFTQAFADIYGILSRDHTVRRKTSAQKLKFIEKQVAFHLGFLSRTLQSGQIEEDNLENADATHFVINMDNRRTLGFSGESVVKYADAVWGGEGMTIVLRISRGRNARIEARFMGFKNSGRPYPIHSLPDNFPGISYRSGPKGWMETAVMSQWLSEKSLYCSANGRRRILYVDHHSEHNQTPQPVQSLAGINTELRYFPPNLTDYIQPCDSVIQKNQK